MFDIILTSFILTEVNLFLDLRSMQIDWKYHLIFWTICESCFYQWNARHALHYTKIQTIVYVWKFL